MSSSFNINKRRLNRYNQIRGLVKSAGSRFMSITFIKKDGSERLMQIQPMGLAKHVKGDKASESAQRAVATRATNNPNLLNVWDVHKKAARSVNMDTVLRLVIAGQTWELVA